MFALFTFYFSSIKAIAKRYNTTVNRYLHSTLVLLKSSSTTAVSSLLIFTFYFSSIKVSKIEFISDDIYLFTFYFSSIKAEYTLSFKYKKLEFTFYFSSIKVELTPEDISNMNNLHSTLVLLKSVDVYDIFSSLVFTFYFSSIKVFKGVSEGLGIDLFTFYFSSIKAKETENESEQLSHLHSTLVLLKASILTLTKASNSIYILL